MCNASCIQPLYINTEVLFPLCISIDANANMEWMPISIWRPRWNEWYPSLHGYEINLGIVRIQQLRLRKRNRWLAMSLNYGLQSHFCDCHCDDLWYCNMNSPKEMQWTYICNCESDVTFAIAIAVCERASNFEVIGSFGNKQVSFCVTIVIYIDPSYNKEFTRNVSRKLIVGIVELILTH